MWTTGLLSVAGAATYFFRPRSKMGTKNRETVKMLGQDGKLVEVEISKISSKRKKIKDKDIHTWVQGKRSL